MKKKIHNHTKYGFERFPSAEELDTKCKYYFRWSKIRLKLGEEIHHL